MAARTALSIFFITSSLSHSVTALAAVSKGDSQSLDAASANQGGGTSTSSQFRQQSSVGEATAGVRLSGSGFRIIPGFLGASLSGFAGVVPVSDLDLTVLYARAEPVGTQLSPATWQRDNDPVFFWEPPAAAPDVAGYSYGVDAAPDDTVDTTSLSFNIATSGSGPWADGTHTFSVKAINTGGKAGAPISIDIWVDTTPPQIVTYAPSSGVLINMLAPAISATVSDASSGVNKLAVSLLVNGSTTSVLFNEATGELTTTGGAWREGPNSLELRVTDLAGNTQAPLVWSITRDTRPPTGLLHINGNADITTSAYVTLGVTASDATSGVVRMLLSNQEQTGYIEEPYVAIRALWMLTPIRGIQSVYVKFVDQAGNVSEPISDQIELALLSPETVITSGPAGFTPNRSAAFAFMCPEGGCLFSFAFDNEAWSAWSASTSVTREGLPFGNHYFRVKAAKEINGTEGIQLDEEDPSPAERTWVVGVQSPILTVPKGPPIKLWRLE